MLNRKKNTCKICGKDNLKGIEAKLHICLGCGVKGVCRVNNKICSKCNEKLPPGSRRTTHLKCDKSEKHYIGYS